MYHQKQRDDKDNFKTCLVLFCYHAKYNKRAKSYFRGVSNYDYIYYYICIYIKITILLENKKAYLNFYFFFLISGVKRGNLYCCVKNCLPDDTIISTIR
jgi:hypothetical protein